MHFPPKFPTFSMVHLLHRLYGVDAPVNMLTFEELIFVYSL